MKSELGITFWEHDLYEHTDDMTLQAQKGHKGIGFVLSTTFYIKTNTGKTLLGIMVDKVFQIESSFQPRIC